MASKTYISQASQLNANLNTWSQFISAISQVIDNYDNNMIYMEEQLEDMSLRINCFELNPSSVQFSVQSVTIESSSTKQYKKKLGIFAPEDVQGSLYIYVNKSAPGLFINDKEVLDSTSSIITIGSITRTAILNITTNNVRNVGRGGIKIMVSSEVLTSEQIKEIDWNSDQNPISTIYINPVTEFQSITKPSTYTSTVGKWKTTESNIIAAENVQTNRSIVNSLRK